MTFEEIMNIINNSESVILYLAPGFLLVGIFSWIIKYKFSSSISLIISGIVTSTIIQKVVGFVDKYDLHFLLVCSLSVLLGYLFGVFYKSSVFNWILLHIGIHRTTQETIWGHLVSNKTWVCIQLKDDDGEIYHIGQVLFVQNKSEYCEDCVVLTNYFLAKKMGDQYLRLVDSDFDERKRAFFRDECKNYVFGDSEKFGVGKHTFYSKIKKHFDRKKDNDK